MLNLALQAKDHDDLIKKRKPEDDDSSLEYDSEGNLIKTECSSEYKFDDSYWRAVAPKNESKWFHKVVSDKNILMNFTTSLLMNPVWYLKSILIREKVDINFPFFFFISPKIQENKLYVEYQSNVR